MNPIELQLLGDIVSANTGRHLALIHLKESLKKIVVDYCHGLIGNASILIKTDFLSGSSPLRQQPFSDSEFL